jgi:hypothetical protein
MISRISVVLEFLEQVVNILSRPLQSGNPIKTRSDLTGSFRDVSVQKLLGSSPGCVICSHDKHLLARPIHKGTVMKHFSLASRLALAALACTGLFAAGQSAHADFIQGPGFQEAGYVPIYELAISSKPNYTAGAPYVLDHSATAPVFDRVGYYLELGSIVNNKFQGQWISISIAAAGFTNDAGQIGVPTFTSGAVFQQNVFSMNVFTNVAGIVTGTGLAGGNVEFWPYNYFAVNSAGVPNASDTLFDWGDTDDHSYNYGSMQIANHNASQMLLSFNDWNNGVNPDLGIGNNTNVDPIDNRVNPDWTFYGYTGTTYQVQNLEVLVHPLAPAVPEPSTMSVAIMSCLLGLGGRLARKRRRSIWPW